MKLILHIPHSSAHIPFFDGFTAPREEIDAEVLKLTDWYTNELFDARGEEMIVADFSRVFCDVERFADDDQEVMAKFGMGVLYEKTDSGLPLRNITPRLRDSILSKYYCIHHQKLNDGVSRQLKKYGEVLILDCHSFADTPFHRDLNKMPDRPDFNIGTDPYHTPGNLLSVSKRFFTEKGYSVGVDWPYTGSIVPLTYYGANKKVKSIMLEVNRKLYLKEGGHQRNEGFETIKKVVQEYLLLLKEYVSSQCVVNE